MREIAYYKDYKSKQNIKLIGESWNNTVLTLLRKYAIPPFLMRFLKRITRF